MKTHKKVSFLLLTLLITICAAFVSFTQGASAAPGTVKQWGDCVDAALGGYGGYLHCNFVHADEKFTYASYHKPALKNTTYRTSNQAGDTKTPLTVNVFKPGSDTDSLGAVGFDPSQYGRFINPAILTSDEGNKFIAYSSAGDNNFILLLDANQKSNGAYQVLALVHNELQSSNEFVYAWDINKEAKITGETGSTVTPSPTGDGKTASVTGDDEACFSSGWALSWAACPVITVAQTLANEMYEFVENQLKFTVSEDGSKSKDSLGDSREEVKNTWNNFRILVSGLVVILMLVMVIGQAIGTGPFDAYTVKKMLPRLVMGVIMIQLSWPIFSFVINLVDALGRGLADIMYAPFGGASALDLNEIMKGFEGYAGTFSWIGVVGAIVGTVVAPFLLIGVLLTVLVAIFAGFLTLLFRKILIILALILVPVALIAWMMPNEGLRKYWKLWWDNFIKALMMFPLIILIIAGGRIFAKIGSGQEDNPVGFFIVLVGFFAPLFILPKTFKWGGTVMSMAGNALTKAQAATMKKPQEYLKKQQEGYSALRDARSAFRYSNPDEYRKNKRARVAALWRRPVDLFKAGALNPLLGPMGAELRARQRAAFVARGDKYDTEQRQEGAILLQKVEDRLHENRVVNGVEGGNKDDMYQDILRIERGLAPLKRYFDTGGRDMDISALMGRGSRARRVMRRAAEDRMVQLGADTNWSHIDAEHERIMGEGSTASAEERTRWRKFLNDNKDTVLEKMPDLLKGVSSVSDINADGIARMHGAGVKRMISQLDHEANHGATPASRAQAQERLDKFLTTYEEAVNTPTLRGQLEQGGRRIVKAYVTRTDADRRYVLYEDPYRQHSDVEDGREVIRERTVPLPGGGGQYDPTSRLLLHPVIETDPATGAAVGTAGLTAIGVPRVHPVTGVAIPSLRDSLDAAFTRQGNLID